MIFSSAETEQSENQNKFQDAVHQDIYANLLINHFFSKYSPDGPLPTAGPPKD